MDTRLYLNLDAVVKMRGQREQNQPDPVAVAILADLGGVDGVALHVGQGSESRERDGRLLRESVSARFDLLLSPAADLIDLAFNVRPDRVILVPERRSPHSPLGGLDAQLLKDALAKHIEHLRSADLEIGVRIEPALDQVKALHRAGADIAVLSTGVYSSCQGAAAKQAEWIRIVDAATLAGRLGLRVAVAGGITLEAAEALARIPQIEEFCVGHAAISRAILKGIENTIHEFKAALERGRRQPL